MANTKEYKIVINGLTESVKAVESLNKELDSLEARIKALEGKTVGVNTSGGGSKSSSTGALSEEEKIQKQIEQTQEKINALRADEYQELLHQKDILKDVKKESEGRFSADNLALKEYANTMQGLKDKLRDLKATINNTDLSDTDTLSKLSDEANQITSKLKEMEGAYGTFSRNVGNYANGVAEGMQKYTIEIGGTVREFNTAREAAKSLTNELLNLPEGAEGAEDLRKALQQIKSEMQDLNKSSVVMDNLLDTMEGFMAVANAGQGIRALFGVDDAEIQKSIKNLVALQNVLKGIETINKQINTGEGVGKWIAPFNTGIDKATAKLLTFNTALLGTGKAAKVAAVSINAFGKALKLAVSAGILIAVDLLVEGLMKLVENFKKVDEETERFNETNKKLAETYGNAQGKLMQYQVMVKNFTGTKKEEKKLVNELNKEFGDTLGTYKSLSEWQDVLKEKGEAYIQTLFAQAKAQAALNEVTAAYMNLEDTKQKVAKGDYHHFYQSQQQDIEADARAIEEANNRIAKAEENLTNVVKENDEIMKKYGTGNYATQIEKNGTKTKNAIEEVQKTLNQLELRLMSDGLNKKLRELDEEERQTINKLKENGRKTGEEIKKVYAAYAALRAKEVQEYLRTLEEKIKESYKNIANIEFNLDTTKISNLIDSLNIQKRELEKLDVNDGTFQGLTSSRDTSYTVDDQLYNSSKKRYEITRQFYDKLIKALIAYQKDEQSLIDENIREKEKKQREEERNRFSIQMSGLTATKKSVEDGMKAIEDKYGEMTETGAIEIKSENKEILDSYRKLQADLLTVDNQIETAKKQHRRKLEEITTTSNNAIKKNELDTAESISSTQEKYYNRQISNYREFLAKMNNEVNQNPITNNWGVVNVKQTKKNYDEILHAGLETILSIQKEKENVDKDLQNGLISDEAADATKKQLDDIIDSVFEGMTVTENASKNLVGTFIQSINQYVQVAGQALQEIMSAVWGYQDYMLEKEQYELDKWNEKLDKALDEQQEIIEKHKDAVESIEDELASSRGDRRQHLIDQINAEMQAQREAQKQEQKIKKEKEAAEKKQDALDKKRREEEYKRNVAQAFISWHLSIANGLATQPFLPVGIAMGALATALGAVQYALVKSQKPYAKGGQLDGGVAQGPRHSQGGIPVLGGRASIEGGEFITNRITTQNNVALLDYINSKKKRIDLSDLIGFYTSGKVKKNISSISPKAKFADGGTLPTISNNYSFDDRLLSAFEDYSNRPVVVAVTDINSKQEQVRNVQVLAGLSD